MNTLLLGSGASIDEMNLIRKHLSRLGGDQLARSANGARVITLLVSDMVGDHLGTLASAPTYPTEIPLLTPWLLSGALICTICSQRRS